MSCKVCHATSANLPHCARGAAVLSSFSHICVCYTPENCLLYLIQEGVGLPCSGLFGNHCWSSCISTLNTIHTPNRIKHFRKKGMDIVEKNRLNFSRSSEKNLSQFSRDLTRTRILADLCYQDNQLPKSTSSLRSELSITLNLVPVYSIPFL